MRDESAKHYQECMIRTAPSGSPSGKIISMLMRLFRTSRNGMGIGPSRVVNVLAVCCDNLLTI